MKFHFESDLDYQKQAIASICDLFHGQEICRSEFTVTRDASGSQTNVFESDLGIGNQLTLPDDQILKNLQEIQLRNGLAPSDSLASGDFTVEMETGTGKTYVYLRTIFELNKHYGFSKFVIVVPSVAIKEGVYKSMELLEEHLRSLYANVPFSKGNNYFIYDSAKLGQVRNFATSPQIQIMVVTAGAINKKDVNNLYKDSEKTGGERPIDLIKATRPILIVDEPQSVDGGLEGRGREALGAMCPLSTLRYSATHIDKHHMVYRLNAVDAYDRKLVKRIEVASATVDGGHNKPYVRLLSVSNKKGVVSAKVELDVQGKSGIQRKSIAVQDGDFLEMTTGREIYHDCRVGEIRVVKENEFLEFRHPGGEVYLKPGEAHGDVDALAVQREMIRRTIKEHLNKEKRLRPQGIKVLSLFFIDAVSRYRLFDGEGNEQKGDYARIFEEEYRRLAGHPDYHTLFEEVDLSSAATEVHKGYFSIDRKKVGGKVVEMLKDTTGDTKADDDTYNLIMREKESLLDFKTPLKFIFSHSALKEGWDNPNVFQICALREMGSDRQRRQTVGRGLRLCVNQDGERIHGFEVNTLTVIATEAYEQFAENLQSEIEEATGIRFGVVEKHQFAAIAVPDETGALVHLGIENSELIWNYLLEQGYVDSKGKVQDSLRMVLKNGSLVLPEQYDKQLPQVNEVLRKLAGKLEIRNADERKSVKVRQAVLHGTEFKALWDRIKHKTTYRVEFDNDKLLRDCAGMIRDGQPIGKTRLQWRKANLQIGQSGVIATETSTDSVTIEERDIELPDLLTDLQDKTQLTRRSLFQILTDCLRLGDFKKNPQDFIDLVSESINRCKRLALVDGIKYQRLGDEHYYAQELFEQKELTGYLKSMVSSDRSIYEEVVYDSGPEADFAHALEKNEAVRVYAKLPGWFKVPTPLGSYNPDWAVVVEKDNAEKLYFVVETKSSLFTDDLRDKEKAKNKCGAAHFKALKVGENPAEYVVATTVEDVMAGV